jgi:hypothetical protein
MNVLNGNYKGKKFVKLVHDIIKKHKPKTEK